MSKAGVPRHRLSEKQIAGILRDIEHGGWKIHEIAQRWHCSKGAVAHHKHPERRSKYRYDKKPLKPIVKQVTIQPHMLPWMTVEMLTGRRAPVARVRT